MTKAKQTPYYYRRRSKIAAAIDFILQMRRRGTPI